MQYLTRPPGPEPAFMIFIVAYRAERHIETVLDRIPHDVLRNPRVRILLIDDAGGDATCEKASDWAVRHQADNIVVLRNPVNQGYGGNQKLGYRLAVDLGFDFTILLHGDGQYAPELLGEFINTWKTTQADVILGSRMQSWKSARAGGMPLYKALGNRILTTFQNFMTGLKLTEYHTGYRGYSHRFLSRVPFEANTNVFHFDTEILLQALHVNAKFVEFPIPTHYGDEICHVNGMQYAWDVVKATLGYKLHNLGMMCSLKYRDLDPTPKAHQGPRYLSQTKALRWLWPAGKPAPQTLLDLGCGAAEVAKACASQGTRTTGIDLHLPVPGSVDEFHQQDLEAEPLPVDPFQYDAILLLDVLEELNDPEGFLVSLRNRSEVKTGSGWKAPLVLVSTPNIGHWAMRLNLLLGRFTYSERGILALNHKRLFTRRTFKRCLRDSGYKIEKLVAVGIPYHAVYGNSFGWFLERISDGFAWCFPSLCAFSFLAVCRPMPGVKQVLSQAIVHHSGAKPASELMPGQQPVEDWVNPSTVK
ncbi:MAG TPA: bifunctional glycosyltransferase/class I SAM-dependent methyltransferase [Gemmatales bacterium]|nr:bifunctional glycosyltransferase/class I SAM-dependent methyltransferase [Gemmatales bacterium]